MGVATKRSVSSSSGKGGGERLCEREWKYVAQDYLHVPREIIVGIDVHRFEDHRGFKLEDELDEVLLEGVAKPGDPAGACNQPPGGVDGVRTPRRSRAPLFHDFSLDGRRAPKITIVSRGFLFSLYDENI